MGSTHELVITQDSVNTDNPIDSQRTLARNAQNSKLEVKIVGFAFKAAKSPFTWLS